jgi:hypothetical protein
MPLDLVKSETNLDFHPWTEGIPVLFFTMSILHGTLTLFVGLL